MVKSPAFFLLYGLIRFSAGLIDEDWNLENCPAITGNITDAFCCEDDNLCTKQSSEGECDTEGGPYCVWENDKCRPIKDSKSNVCCVGKDVQDVCHSFFNGICPQGHQVDRDCCGDQKYRFLKSDDSKVCCNAPCTEMVKANCTDRLPAQCGPQQRSFAMHNIYRVLGFPQPPGALVKHKFGSIIHGTGYGHDTGYGYRRVRPGKHGYEEEDDFDYSKDSHVDEVTMDDVMTLLIEGLEKQTDVKIYDADITSDPYLGKRKSGGLFLDHHFPHADRFFDEIYGEKGQYDHFIRPFEGYAQVYPEYQIMRQPHYGPYPYSDYSPPHYPIHPSYHSYSEYEPSGYSHHSYETTRYDPGYQSHGYGNQGDALMGHYW